jgi:hypothetical protein
LSGGGYFNSHRSSKNKRMIKPMRVEMPDQWENSSVRPDMSIGESIFQSVVNDPIERKDHTKKEAWLYPGDGLSAGHTARHNPELFDEMTRERDLIDYEEYNQCKSYEI